MSAKLNDSQPCVICKRKFKTNTGFNKHMNKHNEEQGTSKGIKVSRNLSQINEDETHEEISSDLSENISVIGDEESIEIDYLNEQLNAENSIIDEAIEDQELYEEI